MSASAIVWFSPVPMYWNTIEGDRMRGCRCRHRAAGTSSTLQEIKERQSHVRFVIQRYQRVLLHIHADNAGSAWMKSRCFSSLQVSPTELKVWEQSVRKHCPPFSKQTSDQPIALLRGNPNLAITTKHESCTKMLGGPTKQMLPPLPNTESTGVVFLAGREVKGSCSFIPHPLHPLMQDLVYKADKTTSVDHLFIDILT